MRGPLDVISEVWTGESGDQELVVSQVVQMRERLQEMMELVQINAEKAQCRQKRLYDRGTSQRTFAAGEKVLVLLPNPHHSLKLEWFGSYQVRRHVSPVDFEVEMPERWKENQIYHINLMKSLVPPLKCYASHHPL